MVGLPKPRVSRLKFVRPGYGLLGSWGWMLLGPPTAFNIAWSSDTTSLWEGERGSRRKGDGRREKREGCDQYCDFTFRYSFVLWWYLYTSLVPRPHAQCLLLAILTWEKVGDGDVTGCQRYGTVLKSAYSRTVVSSKQVNLQPCCSQHQGEGLYWEFYHTFRYHLVFRHFITYFTRFFFTVHCKQQTPSFKASTTPTGHIMHILSGLDHVLT